MTTENIPCVQRPGPKLSSQTFIKFRYKIYKNVSNTVFFYHVNQIPERFRHLDLEQRQVGTVLYYQSNVPFRRMDTKNQREKANKS